MAQETAEERTKRLLRKMDEEMEERLKPLTEQKARQSALMLKPEELPASSELGRLYRRVEQLRPPFEEARRQLRELREELAAVDVLLDTQSRADVSNEQYASAVGLRRFLQNSVKSLTEQVFHHRQQYEGASLSFRLAWSVYSGYANDLSQLHPPAASASLATRAHYVGEKARLEYALRELTRPQGEDAASSAA